jgi:hypothetical protein
MNSYFHIYIFKVKGHSFLFLGRVGLAMSWFSRPSLLFFLYGVPSLGLSLASLSLYSRLASRQACGSLLNCFTCVVIPHGPGRTSQGTSPGCNLLASDGYAHIPLGAA